MTTMTTMATMAMTFTMTTYTIPRDEEQVAKATRRLRMYILVHISGDKERAEVQKHGKLEFCRKWMTPKLNRGQQQGLWLTGIFVPRVKALFSALENSRAIFDDKIHMILWIYFYFIKMIQGWQNRIGGHYFVLLHQILLEF